MPLSKFVSIEVDSYAWSVYVEVLKFLSINSKLTASISVGSYWINHIKTHLEIERVTDYVMKANKLLLRALRYTLIEIILYKKSFVILYLK